MLFFFGLFCACINFLVSSYKLVPVRLKMGLCCDPCSTDRYVTKPLCKIFIIPRKQLKETALPITKVTILNPYKIRKIFSGFFIHVLEASSSVCRIEKKGRVRRPMNRGFEDEAVLNNVYLQGNIR